MIKSKPKPKAPAKMEAKKPVAPRGTQRISPLKQLGIQIMEARNAKGWSLQKLQEKSGKSYVTISALERGLCETVDFRTLEALANALGLKVLISIE
jgi:ribosome-binding protein aMBF1 (putative translation factor)